MSWARSFRILRAAAGLQQAELAKRLLITPSHLSLIEGGKRMPSTQLTHRLAKALNTSDILVTAMATGPEWYDDPRISGQACVGLLRMLLAIGDDRGGRS
jgi:transcriptional regulator with XRE-family HTH domain